MNRSIVQVLPVSVVAFAMGVMTPLAAQPPVIKQPIRWNHSGTQYWVTGTCSGGQVTIRNQATNDIVCTATCENGRFSCGGNPQTANAGAWIIAQSAGGTSAAVKIDAPSDRSLPVPAEGAATVSGRGCYFDVSSTMGMLIVGIEARLEAGTHVVSVYTPGFGGSHVGLESSPSAWTLLGSATVVSDGPFIMTALPMAAVPVTTGGLRGFYLDIAGVDALVSVSAPASTIVAEDEVLFVRAGPLSQGFFTPSAGNGIFSGRILYDAPPHVSPLQRNQGGASLAIDGLESNGVHPAVTPAGAGNRILYVDAAAGLPFDVGVALAPVVAWPAAPALATAGFQTVNLVLTTSTLFFLNGGGINPGPVASPGLFAIPLPGNLPSPLSAQMLVVDPTHPDGVVLSQAVQYGT